MASHENHLRSEGDTCARRTIKGARERRKHYRKGCALRAEYEVGGKDYPSFVSDVSLGGMCLEVRQEHAVGERITVTLRAGKQPIFLRGAVAYVTKADEGWRIGVEFDNLDQDALEAVAFYFF
jgi:hypothetical protein